MSKEVLSCATVTLFNRLELWWRKGLWCRPGEWVFDIDHNCYNRCIIIELGFLGITLLRGECKG